jgi:signal transduction histidine kinase
VTDAHGPTGRDPAEPDPGRRADGGRRTERTETESAIVAEIERRHPGLTWDDAGPRGRHRRWAPGRGWSNGGPSGRGPRPDWWPADEPWPPRRRGRERRFGCLFGLLFAAGVLGIVSIAATLVTHVLEARGPAGFLIRLASFAVVAAIVFVVVRVARTIRGSGAVLDALVDQAARVEAGDYAARVEATGTVPPPVRALARGFNTMAARLETDERERRSLLADVTHELRTPLSVIRGSVEAMLDGVHPADESHLSAVLEETRVLDRLIEDLRTLALSESGGLSLHREPTDLAILVGDVATSFGATATAAGSTIVTSVDESIPLLDVDPVRVREVIGNVVANALRHTPAGGRVTVAARPVDGESVEIVVRDTGPGIDAALLPHVFDRFARGAGSTGSGLGLSIARGIVQLHGGSIEASSPPAGGTEIRIVLPVRAEA